MIKHKLFTQKAFTLVEVIIVMCVLGILAGIAITGYAGYRENIDKTQIANAADAYSKSIKSYALEYEAFPKDSTCLPQGAKCCTSWDQSLPEVYCITNPEAGGDHNWSTTTTDAKISKYINNSAPKFPTVRTFTDCVSGFMDNLGPCKSSSTVPVVGPAYISNVADGKYTSTDPSLTGKGFLIYYIATNMPCGSKDVMTLSGSNLVFNSSATYTRQTSTYRECIIGIRS